MRLASSCVRGIVKEISQCLVRLKVVNKTFWTTNNDHPVCYLRNYHYYTMTNSDTMINK